MKKLSIVLVFCVISSVSFASASKPNIVLIVMDNLGWGEIGVYGGGILRGAETPRLDALASEGMRFLNFNVETQCTPSRSALMTGRHPIRSGTTTVVAGMPYYGLTPWEITLAEMLRKKGYAAGIFGKWHLGDTPGRYPTDQGFDEWYGIANTTDESLYTSGFQYDANIVSRPYIVQGKKGELPENVKPYDRESRSKIDAEITDKTIAFMRRNARKGLPFFAYVPFTQAHAPVIPHPDFQGKTGNGHWADMLAEIDYRAGQILDAIDKLGVRDNTIVIWMSENGPEEFFPHHGTAGPWRGTYFTSLEGSLRAPMLVRWPGRIGAGTVHNEIVHVTDLFPTVASIVNADVPKDRIIDGVNQLDLLTGENEQSARDGFPVYNGNSLQAYKWRNWKFHLTTQETMRSEVIRPGLPRLYNLLTDPKEQYDLIQMGGETGEDQMWLLPVFSKLLLQHQQTLRAERPVPFGAPDDYTPVTQ